ncbi:MAG: polysaccharide pyruvyl transferase [Rhodothermaceae bacterium]|nr:MAG: polysaccharide pyruvyl transferase [Rhodothermaceae bacterium]
MVCEMGKTILINNVYSFRNRGDSAIVESMVSYVRSRCPSANIYLLSQFWEENAEYYLNMGCSSRPLLWDIPMCDEKGKRLVCASKSLISVLWQIMRGKGADKDGFHDHMNSSTLSLYEKADLVLDAGGGSLFSSNKYFFYLGLYQHLFNLWIAKKMGKPVIVAPQSIGPLFRVHDLKLSMFVLREMDEIMVRERFSSLLLEKEKINHHLVPDIAFIGGFVGDPSDEVSDQIRRIDDTYFNVGVTVLDWRWAFEGYRGHSEIIESYLRKIAESLSICSNMYRMKVWVIPQVTAGFGDSDYGVSMRLKDIINSNYAGVEVEVVETNAVNPSDLSHLYSKMDVMIGSRMHSCILSIVQGVPTIGLAYQPKTIGTYELLGLSGYCFDVRYFDVIDLVNKLNFVIQNRAEERDRFCDVAKWAKNKVEEMLDKIVLPYIA